MSCMGTGGEGGNEGGEGGRLVGRYCTALLNQNVKETNGEVNVPSIAICLTD